MSGTWHIPPSDLAAVLEEVGFTVSLGVSPPGRDLRADRELGSAHVEVVLDASGRIRVTTTQLSDEMALPPLEIRGRRLPRVRTVQACTTTTGQISSVADLRDVLDALALGPGE